MNNIYYHSFYYNTYKRDKIYKDYNKSQNSLTIIVVILYNIFLQYNTIEEL